MDYINLKTPSCYSIGESMIRFEDLVELSKKNCSFVAICEKENLFGCYEFCEQAIKNKIKPVVGCSLAIEKIGYLNFFIKNESGYKEICYLLSQRYIRNTPIFIDELDQIKNCICLSGTDNIFSSSNETKEIVLLQLKDIFKENLFCEITIKENSWMLQQAEKYNIPIVLTSEVCFLQKEDEAVFDIFHKTREEKVLKEYKNAYFKGFTDIAKEFKEKNGFEVPREAIENTLLISKKCSFWFKKVEPMMPIWENGDKHLPEICYQKLKLKIDLNHPKYNIYLERLNNELDLLIKRGFSSYFLITSDFVNWAKDNNIPVGPGRGSGAGCLTAYLLGITNIDPIEYNLIFERFLNPERKAIPDFDIDYCPFGRKKVIDYITEKYGKYNVVSIITFGRLQAKAVIRYVAKELGFSFNRSREITSLIPVDQVNPVTLKEALSSVKALIDLNKNEEYRKLFEISLKLEGLPGHLSTHAAGVIISSTPVYNVCPLWRYKKDLVTQFNLKSVEAVGLVKFDFLGLITLTIIQKVFDMVKSKYQIELSFDTINREDKKVFDRMMLLDMEGIFQFENIGIKSVIRDMQPNCLEDLIAVNALYRPGPMKYISTYIDRKNGKAKIEYIHPLTESILKNTYGVIVYQEQVMEIARVCGGYSMAEADLLRRAMGKKNHKEMQAHKNQFISGCLRNKIPQSIGEKLFEDMNEFSGYGFNKSHSAPYALIAYICMYLKCYFPKEFFSQCLFFEMDDEEKLIKYIYNMRFLNISIIEPTVNVTDYHFGIINNSIQYSIKAIKGVGENLCENIIKTAPYNELSSFVKKNSKFLNKKNWESLVLSGSLDCFNVPRSVLFSNLNTIMKGEELPQIEEWPMYTKLIGEQKAFGFFLNNPMEFIRPILRQLGCCSIKDAIYKDSNFYIAGEIISLRQRRKISSGKIFAFLQIGDETNLADVTVFDYLLNQTIDKLKEKNLVVMEVTGEKNGNILKLIAKSIFLIDEFLEKAMKTLRLFLPRESFNVFQSVISPGNCNVMANDENFMIKPTLEILLNFSQFIRH